MLRRIIANPCLFRASVVVPSRAYSSAGYGNATTTQKHADEPPLDIEDPQFSELQSKELHSTPPQHHNNNDAQHSQQASTAPQQTASQQAASQQEQAKEQTERDANVKKQRKEFKRGDKDAVREYSQGCD